MPTHVWLNIGKELPAGEEARLEAAFPGVSFTTEPGDNDRNGIDVVFTRGRLDDDTVAALGGLRWIHTTYGGGLSFLTDDVRARGIAVSCSRGIQAEPLSEFTEACVLSLTKKLGDMDARKRGREWDPSIVPQTLMGGTALMLGLGAVNSAVAQRLHRQGMRVHAIRRDTASVPEYVEKTHALDALPSLIGDVDVVVIGLPPLDELDGLFDEALFRSMKQGAILINLVTRGIIDEAALAKALDQGWIGGAACNAFSTTPLPSDSPLWDAPNLILSPGVASTDPQRWHKLRDVFTANLGRYLRGEPLQNVVESSDR